MKNLSPIANFLIKLSQQASKIMLKYYSPLGITAELKDDMSPITKADMEINQMVIDQVKKNYPDYEILAEEISTDYKNSKKLFVVDPLDGTFMFSIGSPNFAFSAAIVIDGISIAGVISNPLAKRTFIAEKNKGAYLIETNSKIKVSKKNDFDRAIINGGWNDTREVEELHNLNAKTPEIYSVCEAGSLVALGGFDGCIFNSRNAHDIAAVKIIVEEAGGKVTDIHGNEQRYDQKLKGALITNGRLHNQLVKIIKKSGITKDF
jgi:fructose-1,6-bisphosphatase/inositol monophosphatase family enzyme